MAEKGTSVGIDDVISSATVGVLRALDARKAGAERYSTLDLVKGGFGVDIRIICGGIIPWLDRFGGEQLPRTRSAAEGQ